MKGIMIRTKIVCTIGPATRDEAMLAKLMRAGMDVARLNMSHGTRDEHKALIQSIRKVSAEVGKPVALLGDLQGPKLRVGEMPADGLHLERGERVVLTTESIIGSRTKTGAASALIPVQYQDLPRDVQIGDRVLLDDGLMELKVIDSSNKKEVLCEVIIGGVLLSRKGLNLPGTNLSLPAITKKDWSDLDFLLDQGADWVALSFVRRASEVQALKEYIAGRDGAPLVIAKIEKPQALERIDEILEAADGIMVARGDLGIEIPPERVPRVQKDLIRAANRAGKPVITATQMLDSMVRNPRPTRAEASDVANAILDGTDAIMLSGETAAGAYPVESVETMVRIAEQVDCQFSQVEGQWQPPAHVPRVYGDVTDAVAVSACETAFDVRAAAIISATASGRTARSVAKYRPCVPIIAVTPHPVVQRQLMLAWGVIPLLGEHMDDADTLMRRSVELAASTECVNDGDRVVLTAGIANNIPGATNLMTVARVRLAGT